MQVDIYASRNSGQTLPMVVVRLQYEDVAKVVWSEKDPRGWNWEGAAVRPKP